MSGQGGNSNRGGGGGGQGGSGGGGRSEYKGKSKESILDLNKSIDKEVRVKFSGGREVIGTLKGFDQLVNLVLDNCREYLRDDDGFVTEETRSLGLVVCRGTSVLLICPAEGMEEIANPFSIEAGAVI